MRKFRTVALAAILVLPLAAGCGDVVKLITDGVNVVTSLNDDGKAVIEALEKEASTLPVGDPVRVAIEEKIVRIKEVMAKGEEYLGRANETITSIGNGELSPDLRSALALVPYGVYISGGLSLLLALMKHLKASKTTDALRKVVQSWQEVGEELTPDEKKLAAEIQGREVTDLVHSIKTELAAR